MTERITVEAVEAAVVEYDAQDRAVIAGSVVVDFTQAGVLVSLLAPSEWEVVAAYLYALIEREPVKSGKSYVPHRTVLGALAGELRGYAKAAGQDVGLEADLRAATSGAEERRISQRVADQNAAFDRHIDDTIASHRAQHELAQPAPEEPPQEEPPDVTEPAAQQLSDDDVRAWL